MLKAMELLPKVLQTWTLMIYRSNLKKTIKDGLQNRSFFIFSID